MTYDPGSSEDRGQQQPQQPQGGWPPQQPPGSTYPGGFPQQPPPGWAPNAPGPGAAPPPGYFPPGGMAPGQIGPQSKGFFAALFDVGFTAFITPTAVKVLYAMFMVLLALGYIFMVISSFATAGLVAGLITLLIGAVGALFALILFRVTLEFYFAVVRMSEDIHKRESSKD